MLTANFEISQDIVPETQLPWAHCRLIISRCVRQLTRNGQSSRFYRRRLHVIHQDRTQSGLLDWLIPSQAVHIEAVLLLDRRVACLHTTIRVTVAARLIRHRLIESAGSRFICAHLSQRSGIDCTTSAGRLTLRRSRTDALELAPRKGPLSFFITLRCNPYWEETLSQLPPGQSAADRPDLVVRVSHAKLEIAFHFLTHDFCGKRLYVVRFVEYLLRGLPHAHTALAVLELPQTAE